MNLSDFPHKRLNPLTGEWILVSPHRTKRPWQGKIEQPIAPLVAVYEPKCFLCPGNQRAGNAKNPAYQTTFAFDNDLAALLPEIPEETMDEQGLLVARSEPGLCRVICHSPRHDQSFPLLSPVEISAVIDTWTNEYREIGSRENINHVLIFENRGESMGAVSPHPHSHLWATKSVPTLSAQETARQREYAERRNSCLLCDYARIELRMQSRVILTNDTFAAITPFWAGWPFEVLLIPLAHCPDLGILSKKARTDFADILHRLTIRFDNLFGIPFPYTMGIHQRPTDGEDHAEWHMHAHFFSPLMRSLSTKKMITGYEAFGMPLRDVSPEDCARKLRNCPDSHYTNQIAN